MANGIIRIAIIDKQVWRRKDGSFRFGGDAVVCVSVGIFSVTLQV